MMDWVGQLIWNDGLWRFSWALYFLHTAVGEVQAGFFSSAFTAPHFLYDIPPIFYYYRRELYV